jgi:hypothetical protein
MDVLFAAIEGIETPAIEHPAPQLIVRASTGPPPEA